MSKLPTYAEVATKLGIEWCYGGTNATMGSKCRVLENYSYRHQHGYADIPHGIVHWFERKTTRSGLRHFLMLVGACRLSHNRGQPRWQMTYEQNVYAYKIALEVFKIRFALRESAQDRLNVRWWLLDAGSSPKVKEARAWGSRSERKSQDSA